MFVPVIDDGGRSTNGVQIKRYAWLGLWIAASGGVGRHCEPERDIAWQQEIQLFGWNFTSVALFGCGLFGLQRFGCHGIQIVDDGLKSVLEFLIQAVPVGGNRHVQAFSAVHTGRRRLSAVANSGP